MVANKKWQDFLDKGVGCGKVEVSTAAAGFAISDSFSLTNPKGVVKWR